MSPHVRCSPIPHCVVESFEPRVLMAIGVAVGTGAAANRVVFTDADGTAATVRVTGGAATLTFDAPDVAQSTANGVSTVTGTNVRWLNAVITGDNPSVAVSSAGGDGTVALSGMNATGPVNSFSGRGVVLNGFASLNNGIRRLELAGLQNAPLLINRPGDAPQQNASVSILAVRDAIFTSHHPFRLLRVGSWTESSPDRPNMLVAPRINVLQSGGDFTANLGVSGSGQAADRPILGNVRVLGALAAGDWTISGRAGRIAAGSVAETWRGLFADVSTFAVSGDLAGDVQATSINALTADNINGSEILASATQGVRPALNRLAARGAISGSIVRTLGSIGSVSAGSITGSTISAGINTGNELPTSANSFAIPATIHSVTVRDRGTTPAFSDSNIMASTLGRMNLGAVQVSNGGNPFGLAGQTIQSVSALGANNAPIRASRLAEPADSIDQTDFEVRIF